MEESEAFLVIANTNPYLAFNIQGRTKFSHVAVKGGSKPEWNQTIKYNQIHDSNSTGSTTLTVSCVHKKTGVKLGHSDGLIGKCEIELREMLFASERGVYQDWFQLMHDGKEAGRVHLRIALCEPSAEEDETEVKPIRYDSKNRPILSRSDKKTEKKVLSTKPSAASSLFTSKLHSSNSNNSSVASPPLESTSSSSSKGAQPSSIQRVPSRLNRPRSMADLKERKTTIRFQEPTIHRLVSKSMEEVRDSMVTPMGQSSSDGDSFQTEEEDERSSISSPKQTFTLQDSEGNINPLNVLIAPFDPSWLEPTPPILKRALSAQYYYEDLHTQMATNPRELFPRPQSQQSHYGYLSEPQYNMPNSHHHQHFQSFGQAHSGYSHPSQQPPQQQQYQQQQQYLRPFSPDGQQQQQQRPFSPDGQQQQQQPSQMQHLQSAPTSTSSHTSAQGNQGSFGTEKVEVTSPTTLYSAPITTQKPTLGPAAGYLPDTYSQEHQRALSSQLAQPLPPTQLTHPTLGPDPRNGKAVYRLPGTFPETERPSTRNMHYPTQPMSKTSSQSSTTHSAGAERPSTRNTFYPTQPMSKTTSQSSTNQTANGPGPNQPLYHSSPTVQESAYIGEHSQSSSVSYSHGRTASLDGVEPFSTMLKSPAVPIPARIPIKARDAIFAQYKPRAVTWEGKDIQDSVMDGVGRRILSRYALGMTRERYVREGFYIKERSPLIADGKTIHQRQQQQRMNPQRPVPQRQFTMEQEGNDRVILKYLKSRREWEIDCVMMRYLTCQQPEVKLESQYLDYPQPQQHNQIVNPFVAGLYETFHHPHATDYECRFLSVVQWYPETLQDYIQDRIASAEGLEVTLPVIRSLIECVEWIHSRKICHLNIKPTNFVRDPYATSSMSQLRGAGWKLIDFEAARVIDEEIVGRCTFSYAAPEILEGHATTTAVRTRGSLDIWSLGLVIYELLTDQPLFQTDEQAKERLLPKTGSGGRSIQPVRYYDRKYIDQEYHALLDAMLIRDPEKRLTASQLLNMDLFKTPISSRPVSQEQLIRNNNIQTLRDLKQTRLCNLKLNSGDGGVPGDQHQLLEGIGRILDSPFDQVPRLFMLLPPMAHDMDPSQPFMATNLFQNKGMRLVLLCEGLSGYGEDAHVTDHRGYTLYDPTAFVQDVGKLLLYLVAVAGTNNPGYETPGLDKPLTLTGTPLDNCQRWYTSLRSYYEILQAAILRQLGSPAPSLNELRQLRGPTLKSLESWLARLVRKQSQVSPYLGSSSSTGSIRRRPSTAAPSETVSHGGMTLGGSVYDDLSDQLSELGLGGPEVPEVTGPGGGQGYGGLYKMPVGTCGDRWICRGCVSKQMAMAAESAAAAAAAAGGHAK
ncbi:hypothetical protein BGX33_001309 [Mortierella sp. NVP41]|nr:hypothetical protein BGX33_001309 [Mortierella sp. NVP41]